MYYGSNYGGTPPGDGVIGWNYGSGRVLSLSTLAGQMELGDPNYGRLFGNGVTGTKANRYPNPPRLPCSAWASWA